MKEVESRATGNATKKSIGVGMPYTLYLHQFGDILSHAFDGEIAYHVGSSLTGMTWRDVDVRMMLSAEKYKEMGFGDPKYPHTNEKWVAYVMAFSELGHKMTGLPIDFQIQESDTANEQYKQKEGHRRSALMMCDYRRLVKREQQEKENDNTRSTGA